MAQQFLVQVGAMGAIGRFEAVDWTSYRRNDRVVCRTERGLEVGRVMAPSGQGGAGTGAACDGQVLRLVSIEDQLLITRLEQYRDEAFAACQELLNQRGVDAVLVDVEHLFDGQSVFFYFLGEVDAATKEITAELAESYEKTVRFRKFSETLVEGCGPDCGTESAAGCGNDCSDCAASATCSISPKRN